MEAFTLLPDPQTNGGLLFTVKEESLAEVFALDANKTGGATFVQIGKIIAKTEKVIEVSI
jgi:selenide,water dikinase